MNENKNKVNKYTFLLDVDGVMTTGQYFYSETGKMFKVFGPHDSDGLKLVDKIAHIEFISADKRGFSISKKRIVDDMGYNLTLVSEQDRLEYVKENFDLQKLIYMGDGLFDAPILEVALFGISPANGRKEAIGAADFITESKSGEGAVLDACLEILRRYNAKKTN